MNLLELLRTPDAQDDPYEWSSGLLAHALIGVALAALLPLWLVLLGYLAWELTQWWLYAADPWDCVLDWCAFTLGSCVAFALYTGTEPIGAVLALGAVLFAGARKRE